MLKNLPNWIQNTKKNHIKCLAHTGDDDDRRKISREEKILKKYFMFVDENEIKYYTHNITIWKKKLYWI